MVGDYLFDRQGNETLVLGVYPQGLRKVWEITFDDGRKAKCCEDHLWSFYKNGEKYLTTLSLKKILQREDKFDLLFPINKMVKYNKSNYYEDRIFAGGIALGYNQNNF